MAKQREDSSTQEIPETFRFRTAYGPRLRVITDVSGESLTKQSFKDECDINVIMKRYRESGFIPFLDGREPRYMDCTGFDFQQAQLVVAEARSAFEELPAHLRDRFENDPRKFLDFVHDEKNREEAEKLGLVRPKDAEPAPVKVELSEVPAALLKAPEGKERPSKEGGKTS